MANRGRTATFIRGGLSSRASKMYADRVSHNNPFDGWRNQGLNFTSAKSHAIGRKNRNQFGGNLRIDEDVAMDGEAHHGERRQFNNQRGVLRQRGRGGVGGRGRKFNGADGRQQNRANSQFNYGPSWHRITVKNGSPYEEDFILNNIYGLVRNPISPIGYIKLGVNACFYVETRSEAETVAETSGKFIGTDGQPINLRIDSYGVPPTPPFDDKLTNEIKTVLQSRYAPSPPRLDLSDFANGCGLKLHSYLPLFRPSVTAKLLEELSSILPTLVGVDLSRNNLTSMDSFSKLPQLAPNLVSLNLRSNKLREIYQLEKLRGLKLTEINLEGNPFCSKMKDTDDYLRAVQKIFPKVTKLDGNEVSGAKFDLEEIVEVLPDIRPSFTCNEEARKVVLSFVEEYFKIYDSESRDRLLDAYHEAATFALQCSYLKGGNPALEPPETKLSAYVAHSRNFFRNPNHMKAENNTHKGKISIVAFLTKLPKTTHDVGNFTIDITIAETSLIHFTLTGVFKERNLVSGRTPSLRYFHRTLILIPLNSGYSIVNEMLLVTNATKEQSLDAFKGPVPTIPNISSLELSSGNEGNNEEIQMRMIQEFARESTMNHDWAKKCLEQNGWDYKKSALVFTELHKNGQIPAEAFIKLQ